MLGVGPLGFRRHEVVVLTCDEQQGCSVGVVLVHVGVAVAGVDVGEGAVPEDVAGGGTWWRSERARAWSSGKVLVKA